MVIAIWLSLTIALTLSVSSGGLYDWSFQQRIQVPNAGPNYAKTPSALFGRGFLTLITGYGGNQSGIYVHTTDEGYVHENQYVWSQQAVLVASGTQPGDEFGKWMVASNNTLIVSAPNQANNRGFAYIFNGTLRHWSQIQRLGALEGASGDFFGEYMSLYENTLIVGAKGSIANAGSAYVFERQPGGYTWSRQGRLLPRDGASGQYFAERLALHTDTVVISSRNDDRSGQQTGSAYIFARSKGLWSQQQKLVSVEFMNYEQGIELEKLDLTLGSRFLGPSVIINSEKEIAIGITNVSPAKTNRESIYVFSTRGTTRWSLQQKLFAGNDSTHEMSTSVDLYNDKRNTIVATVGGPNISSAYVFKIFGNQSFEAGWSLHSRLLPYNETADGLMYDDDAMEMRPGITNFSTPTIWGGAILFRAENEVQIRTRLHNQSCIKIWMSDHFLDGWDTAVLTVIAPDQSNDTFAPHCDQVDPFYVRYCPYDPNDEGIYIVKVFAAIEARFFWEVSWRVQLESTGEWFQGDFASKMKFNFNATTSTFSFVEGENLIDFEAPCYRCTTIGLQTWANLQQVGNFALWPLTVHGAPWYISDYQARVLYSTGKVCQGVSTYECYQTVPDGVYILRLGGGLFGRLLDFPYAHTNWTGCGASGDHLDQLVFRIANSECTPLQVFRYTHRCARPPPINLAAYSSTASPTGGGTVAPTQSTFGDPYVKGQMYGKTGNRKHHQSTVHLSNDENTDQQQEKSSPQQRKSDKTFGFKVEEIVSRHTQEESHTEAKNAPAMDHDPLLSIFSKKATTSNDRKAASSSRRKLDSEGNEKKSHLLW